MGFVQKTVGGGGGLGGIFKGIKSGVGQLNPLNKGSTVGKIVQQVPGVKEAQNVATQVLQPVEKAVVQPVSKGLASFDKAVGNAIPGGWGTVASVAGSMMGVPTPYLVGLGALTGSGVMRPGRSFNMQGAIMGGAMAYGTAQLGQYARAAGGEATIPLTEGVSSTPELLPGSMPAVAGELGDIPLTAAGNIDYSGAAGSGYNAGIASGAVPTDMVAPTIASTPAAAEIAGIRATQPGIIERAADYVQNIPSAVGTKVSSGLENLKAGFDTATTPETYSTMAKNAGENFSNTTEGIKNILSGSATPIADQAVKSGAIMSPGTAALLTGYAGMSLADLDAQAAYLKEQKAAGNIAQAEYDAAMAEIERSTEVARQAVAQSPFSTTPDRSASVGETYYGRDTTDTSMTPTNTLYERTAPTARLYATGGSVDDENGMDEARGLFQGNMQNGFMGGGIAGYAAGGMPPRFLSGGGDGMSDSIKASIEGKQEARLADGEFVIPADVVSHLGNGSSKAGAKQLYSMMDRVRSARTGNKKQGKQINPRKYMAA